MVKWCAIHCDASDTTGFTINTQQIEGDLILKENNSSFLSEVQTCIFAFSVKVGSSSFFKGINAWRINKPE
jgi:hypothetical protein